MSRFFIDRPVFASVLSIIIALCGLASLFSLPVEQSPQITPPTVIVNAVYPGANAETVSESLAAPIEQELSGIDNLLYYQSQSANDGSLSITVTFEIGANLDIAAVEVQNRLKRAEPRLPQEVIRQGIAVNKQSTNILNVIALNSDDPQYDSVYLSNYATIHMIDTLKRVPGVGDVMVFGSKDYSMRIWLNPNRLAVKKLTVTDVADAIREQNGLYAAGRIGSAPSKDGVEFTIPVITHGRLNEPKEYEDIILRAEPDGSVVRLKDVGRVELGSLSYDSVGRLNGKPTTLMLIFSLPDANALNTIAGVKAALDQMQSSLPKGVKYDIPFDTTKFIDVSIDEVRTTFIQAVLLVMAVVFVFLGSWRATLIPLLAVPVAIIGTFTGMLAFGFSINSLTLFGLVLAIGIVVDDAIVVVENVERIMHEEGLQVREATIKAMDQVTGPVIAIVLVLSAVYLPVAFLGGITGVMYRQFAVTIAISVAISGLVALTLSPALCRLLLKPTDKKIFVFRWFDDAFTFLTGTYTRSVRVAIRLGVISVLVFGVLMWATFDLFKRVPSAFIPQEDQGYFNVVTMLPQGASIERTSKVMREVEDFLLAQPEIERVVSLGGVDFLAGRSASTSAGAMFINLKPWDERPTQDKSVDAMVGRVFAHFGALKEARVIAFNPPAIRGLGMRAGFEVQLESRGISDIRKLAQVTDQFIGELRKDPSLVGVAGVMNVNQPQLYVDLDRYRAKAMGLPIGDIYNSLQAYLGALYVNDFNKFGRIYRVQVQAEPEFRSKPEDIRKIFVRNKTGDMVELSGVLDIKYQSGPNVVSRFNSFPSVQISGAPALGSSTGQAMQRLSDVAAKVLPAGYELEWSGASYQEAKAGNHAPYVVAFGLVVVFLVLAAQYEKWSLPFAVLLAVPFGIFGAILAVYLRGLERDIYFQIGLLTLVGLAAKNAILIVEFCSKQHEEGKGVVEAALEAARLRLRPIVMTSLAFILGVLPLVFSHGAGASGRHSIGTGVMGGMLAATFLAVLFVPLFFVIIQKISEFRPWRRHTPSAAPQSPTDETQAHRR
ncbi:MAG: multidrug efflux RND transporter permease subunit [Candidatus Hydrogenedentes bacterium]|nr:multidrug efflux RND transporter permease subunit [Candidatus Hydrogenedentota bacterium]